MANRTAETMPARDAARLRKAVRDFRSPDLPPALAAIVLGAHRAGWSYRTIARALDLSRERTMQLADVKATPYDKVPSYRAGAAFPEEVIAEFRRRAARSAVQRERTRARAAATVKAANDAGWTYALLSSLVCLSDERISQIAQRAVPDQSVAPFTPAGGHPTAPADPSPPPLLPSDMAARMAALAKLARHNARKGRLSPAPGVEDEERRAAARRARTASEELSDLIIEAKNSGVRWADIEAACGYRPGAARARAVRHGYGSLPPSRRAYQRTTPVDTSS